MIKKTFNEFKSDSINIKNNEIEFGNFDNENLVVASIKFHCINIIENKVEVELPIVKILKELVIIYDIEKSK